MIDARKQLADLDTPTRPPPLVMSYAGRAVRGWPVCVEHDGGWVLVLETERGLRLRIPLLRLSVIGEDRRGTA